METLKEFVCQECKQIFKARAYERGKFCSTECYRSYWGRERSHVLGDLGREARRENKKKVLTKKRYILY